MKLAIGPRQSISRRLIVYILLFSSAITLIATSLQLYFDYSRDVGAIYDRMSQIKNSYLRSITSNLWAMDREQLQVQIEGIRRLPDMQFVAIRVNGDVFMSTGEATSHNVISNTFDMKYHYNGTDITLGTLTVSATLDDVVSRMIDKVLLIFFSQSVKTFLVSAFIFLIFYLLVTRHLHRMSEYTSGLDVETLDRPLRLDRPSRPGKPADELDHVVQAINDMRLKLRASWEKLDAEHRRRLKAERLAAIGELSASVAHEIRNPLASIVNAVEILRRKATSAKNRAEAIALANAESQRLQHILSEFLQFSRQVPPHFRSEDVEELIADVAESLQLSLDQAAAIRIEKDFDTKPCVAVCDRTQIRQVIWNLMLNGVQAMPEGGTLCVSTRANGESVRIGVTDTGHGIDENMREEVIKPFVTQRANGTGLGLSVAQKILVDHGTELSISSTEDHGTEVYFHLVTGSPS